MKNNTNNNPIFRQSCFHSRITEKKDMRLHKYIRKTVRLFEETAYTAATKRSGNLGDENSSQVCVTEEADIINDRVCVLQGM